MKHFRLLAALLLTLFATHANAADVRLQELRTNYMKTCLGNGGVKEVCKCSFDEARQNMPQEEFENTIRSLNANLHVSTASMLKMKNYANSCVLTPGKLDPQEKIDAQVEPALVPPPPPPPLPGSAPIAIPQPPSPDGLTENYLPTDSPAPPREMAEKPKKKAKKKVPAEERPKAPKYFGQYDNQFFSAAIKGDLNGMRAMLQQMPGADIQDVQGNTPLMVSVIYSNDVSMKFLLESNASPNAKNNKGQTALHLASFINRPDMVETLLSYAADPNLTYGGGYTPLILAVMKQDEASVYNILKYKAKPDSVLEDGNTALHIAAGGANMKIIAWLATYGAKINAQNKQGYTPLMIAAYNGNAAAVQTLLGYKANTALHDKSGRTAAMLAQMGGHNDIAQFLSVR